MLYILCFAFKHLVPFLLWRFTDSLFAFLWSHAGMFTFVSLFGVVVSRLTPCLYASLRAFCTYFGMFLALSFGFHSCVKGFHFATTLWVADAIDCLDLSRRKISSIIKAHFGRLFPILR